MIKYTVKDQPQPSFVHLTDQFSQVLLRSERRINFIIVHRIVLVVGRCVEDRCQIEAGGAQIAYVIQALNDPLDVTAHEVFSGGRTAPGISIGGRQPIVTAAVALGKDLVVHLLFVPIRRTIPVPFIGPEKLKEIFVDGRFFVG